MFRRNRSGKRPPALYFCYSIRPPQKFRRPHGGASGCKIKKKTFIIYHAHEGASRHPAKSQSVGTCGFEKPIVISLCRKNDCSHRYFYLGGRQDGKRARGQALALAFAFPPRDKKTYVRSHGGAAYGLFKSATGI